MKRHSISKTLRFMILDRDGFSCQYCGRSAPSAVLHIDHVVPVSRGGQSTAENLVTSCSECNHGKRDKALSRSESFAKALADEGDRISDMVEWMNPYPDWAMPSYRKPIMINLMEYSGEVPSQNLNCATVNWEEVPF